MDEKRKHFVVQLEGCRAVFVNCDAADSPEKAVEVARDELRSIPAAATAKHIHTEVFAGQSLSEVIRG